MPPRYAYWTIIVDDQPTAFRSASQEELMPTFKRLKAKNATAVMMWWQNGKLWPSRDDAQEMMRARGEMGRRGDERQAGSGFRERDRKPFRERSDRSPRSAWTPHGEPSTPAPKRNADDKLDWKPKGEFVPAPKRTERPDWKPKSDWSSKSSTAQDFRTSRPDRREKPEWKPKGSFDRERKSDWKPKSDWVPKSQDPRPRTSFKRPDFKPSAEGSRSAKPEWKPKGSYDRDSKPASRSERADRPVWTPKSQASSPRSTDGEKRKWLPKEEYKKSMGIEAKRDSKWRPGGEHKDPRQKYKDAKKAKWSKFKENIRARHGAKPKKKS